ncbi:MAG: NAD(P)H-hydrate dehydratase [Bacteroidetes bacterium]|nr:NAD(P)H-hydrate dehydratase [Bacteroidota bacterium]MBU1579468.1 NAD(P)H-hydrate dehydratase [Bacteroidota bacterium]MBU2466224.1 NAD(P)H-hydrate dehydratase [Bacteroidota bacterium]MBU2557966.1 NAD(P)H-hydrate dehydratase [Bacteroidota bacterium]
MKILTVEQIRQADTFTIEHEPILSVDLMERAANQVFEWIRKRLQPHSQVMIFAGTGNNGGDGLVLARLLIENGYSVTTCLVWFLDKLSPDCETNLQRLKELTDAKIVDVHQEADLPVLTEDAIVVDALFGSGLNKPLKGIAADTVKLINGGRNVVVAIDIPSGLYADKAVDAKRETVLEADYTISFEFPKMAFLWPENDRFVGRWEVLPIGLHTGFTQAVQTPFTLIDAAQIQPFLKKRAKFSHKGTYGHALLIAGSAGKTGAAILSARACLRTGAGLLHVHLPGKAQIPMQSALPEAMISMDSNADHFSELPELAPFNTIAIGPGLGMHDDSVQALKLLIQQSRHPLILDADALNILSENRTWLAFLPKNSILTPHPGEFERLAGSWSDSFERLELQRQLSLKFGIIIILKGAHSCVTLPDGQAVFNTTGNPGMATAGSGDVLTGMLTGLLAQQYSPMQAALLAVYLHGVAGDLAAEKLGMESVIASDIVYCIAKAFKSL